uniref:Arrestin C-terminal-like domain-containing protein n=1 Tax=Amphiprion ocellaris TaxID=80972 RepID=A0A3Q1AVN6_AMPOC
MTVKHLSVEYDKVNDRGTFSPGDILSGKVTVVTSKEIKVQSFVVKAKGKAKVTWCEQEGQTTVIHCNKKKYFNFEHIILQDKKKGDGSEIISPGRNVYPFNFVIPNTDMPSSYKGRWGTITYKMIIIGLKNSSKHFKICLSDKKMGLMQGEAMGISVEVINGSARTVTPKFYLCEKQTFVAQSKRMVHTNDIFCGTGDSVPAETSRTVTKILSIPPQLPPTFFNCCMMKLEYRLKVLLLHSQVQHNETNPEIKLPLVILLGSPKPLQQKPKRSIWFRKLPS